jgi:hypothetical protein
MKFRHNSHKFCKNGVTTILPSAILWSLSIRLVSITPFSTALMELIARARATKALSTTSVQGVHSGHPWRPVSSSGGGEMLTVLKKMWVFLFYQKTQPWRQIEWRCHPHIMDLTLNSASTLHNILGLLSCSGFGWAVMPTSCNKICMHIGHS